MKANTLLSFVASASAHATWQQLWVNGLDKAGACLRVPPNNSPITNVTSNDIRCNVGGTIGVSGICDVEAGQVITIEMHQQPNDRTCANEAIGGSHDGPVIVYMSKVSNAKTADGSAPWFKVSQYGYDASIKRWGNQLINENCGKYTFAVPKDISPGDYLLRAEVIALHVASQPGGAQFYNSCFQLGVHGDGSATPNGVSFPGAYKASDLGIQFNIYQPTISSYPIPGPTVYASK